jgi:drug/metabolite transporter (DMT)-like permease
VIQGTLIAAALPIFVLVAARVFLDQPITGRQLVGIVISVIGVATIVVRGDLHVLRSFVLNVGDVWILAAVCMWAAQTILIRFVPKEMDLVAFQVMAFVAGLAVLGPFYIYETVGGRPLPLSWSAALLVGYAGLAASVVGFTCWNLGVMPAQRQQDISAIYFRSSARHLESCCSVSNSDGFTRWGEL